MKLKQLLNDTDIKKAIGIHSIPPKFVKMPSNIITEPLTTAISNCLTQNVFSKIAKIALVTPINKGKSNKYEVSNCRPISILNIFSKT